ncbi:hypothetical protein BGZ99_001638, partial [Dissophora globulifera]
MATALSHSHGHSSSSPAVSATSDTGPPPRTVPRPRPGELLIYDCRRPNDASASATTHTTTSSSSTPGREALIAATSPPTPTPDPKDKATFQARHTVRYGTANAQERVLSSTLDNSQTHTRNNGAEQGATASSANLKVLSSGGAATTAPPPSPGLPRSRSDLIHQEPSTRLIRILQWNIERNYKSAEILATLSELDADILCIQEIDIGCHRTGYDRDHFLEICHSQGLHGGFVPEFWELEHPGRKDRDQGGGVHGNAILSRWPINGFRVLDHVHHAYEWERDGLKLNEPRLGRRFTIVADIQTPSGPLLCYCAHLEVFTGIVGRISALSDILSDSELYSEQYPYQILFGDLNTISHSIARLAKTISTDQYRIASLGLQEAEWWDRNLWSWHIQDGEFNLALASAGWSWLRRLGFLGLGTGINTHINADKEVRTSCWPADDKYTAWLKNLVRAGLTKVKQARQQQLLTDRYVALDSVAAADDDCAGDDDYSVDGSIVLVGRPGSSMSTRIIPLDSSAVNMNEDISSSSTSVSTRSRHQSEGDDSDDDWRSARRSRTPSTPSTPSPTLRLIPPTPTQGRVSEERGIPILYDDSDEDGESDSSDEERDEDGENDSGDEERDDDLQRRFNDQYLNDDNTETTLRLSPNGDKTNNNNNNNDTLKNISHDSFQEPQPPFLLSTLETTDPFFATQRLWSGFTPLVLYQARNPGFYDPWSAGRDLTLHNPNFFGLLKAKLDYTLLMNLKCVQREVGNHDYSASDHKWLLVEVEFEREFCTGAQDVDGTGQREKDVLPSREQRYLWWRERRREWGQEVQPFAGSERVHGAASSSPSPSSS